jgi:hypothetical protein
VCLDRPVGVVVMEAMSRKWSMRMLGAVVSLPLLLTGCGDGEQVEEVRWLAKRVIDNGRAVRLATANSSSARPEDVRVRMDEAEVGLTLRLRVPEVRLEDLRLQCAEVKLSEPVDERRLVDDGSGPFKPLRASVEAAERLLAEGELPCAQVPVASE